MCERHLQLFIALPCRPVTLLLAANSFPLSVEKLFNIWSDKIQATVYERTGLCLIGHSMSRSLNLSIVGSLKPCIFRYISSGDLVTFFSRFSFLRRGFNGSL